MLQLVLIQWILKEELTLAVIKVVEYSKIC